MTSPEVSPIEPSSFSWILEHLLAYPGTYEIPLRTMYTNNVLAQANRPNHPRTPSLSASSSSSSPISPQTPHFAEDSSQQFTKLAATDHFKSCLMEHISYLPSQPFSLPPSFITSFVRRCFTEDLCLVDFTQALTALDYLKDLETRRKRELSAVLRRLGISGENFGQERETLGSQRPEIAEWLSSMEDKERRVEALYTQVYIGLRRWTLINEMRLSPFNKANCIAMLNTLYPPSQSLPPTPQLTPTILQSQRHAFFRYIQAVEKNGKGVLANLENQSRRPGDRNGWAVVREIVDKYLRTSNAVIDECVAISGPEDLKSQCNGSRRADSGVSFGSNERPSTSSGHYHNTSISSEKENQIHSSNNNKPLPASPALCPPTPNKRGGSTLERIAREFRRLKSRSSESREREQSLEAPDERSRSRPSLKKMRSTSNLAREGSGKRSGLHSRGNSGERAGVYEIDEARRERLIREAVAKREKERGERQKENRTPVLEGGRF